MQTSIEFHILKHKNLQEASLYACHLVEQYYLNNMSVIILTNHLEHAKFMDELLWIFSEKSFIPHAIAPVSSHPITVCYETSQCENLVADIYINLSQFMPPLVKTLPQKVLEIVFSDESMQQLARERFKKYRELGLTISTIQHDK